MTIKVNLNNHVKVKLNDFGRWIYYNFYKSDIHTADDEGFSEFHLWEFMQIYGRYCYMGGQPFLDGFELFIDDYEECTKIGGGESK